MRKTVVFVSLVSLLVVSLLGGCSKASTTTSAVTTSAVTTTKPATTTAATTSAATTSNPTTTTTTAAPKPTTTALKPLPGIINMPARSGSGTGDQTIALADALTKKLGVKFAAQPVANELEQLTIMKAKQGDITISGTATILDPIKGINDFAKPAWGPQALRTITRSGPLMTIYYTTKQSGINTWNDVKGKKMAWWPASQVRNDTGTLFLEAMGLSWDDVKKVNVDSTKVMDDALLAGVIDIGGPVTYPTASLVEIHATKGLVILPFNPTPERAKVFIEKRPQYALQNVAKGSIIGAEQDMQLPSSPNQIVCYDWVDEDLIFQFARAVYEIVDSVQVLTSSGWNKANAVALPVTAPYHPGAVRYYKEIGVWTAEHEKIQQQLLQSQKDRLAEWQKANPK